MQQNSPSRYDLIARLQRMMGVHIWSLNLNTGLLRIEYGRAFDDTQTFELPRDELASLLSPNEMEMWKRHWDEGEREGHTGPTNVPFVKSNGEVGVVESVCALHASGSDRSLIGVFKRVTDAANFGRNARLLTQFLESFIEHSPSGIVVIDQGGKVISANREFIRFVGRASRTEILQRSVLDLVYAISPGLGNVVRDVLRNNQSSRGRYEITHSNGTRETLYWRAFPLSLDTGFTPPKVFTFDLNEGGARVVAA